VGPLGLLLDRQQPLHFIGIGGIGMSALAVILVERGFQVSGSDSRESAVVEDLRRRGVRIHTAQDAASFEALCQAMAVPPPGGDQHGGKGGQP